MGKGRPFLREVFKDWGNYKVAENCVYLYDNIVLQDKKFMELVKLHVVKIQPDLFT